MRRIAATEIGEALRQGGPGPGNYKIIFRVALTLESGSVKADDAATIQAVLDAILTEVPYGIVVNKLSRNSLAEIQHDENAQKTLCAALNDHSHTPTAHICLYEEISDLKDAFHMAHSPTQELITGRLIHSIPSCNLRPEAVRQVQADLFEGAKKELEARLAFLIADQEERDHRWAQLEQVDELNRQLQAAVNRGGGGWCALFSDSTLRTRTNFEGYTLAGQHKPESVASGPARCT
jgi:hypothetical protein